LEFAGLKKRADEPAALKCLDPTIISQEPTEETEFLSLLARFPPVQSGNKTGHDISENALAQKQPRRALRQSSPPAASGDL
jgi:hypothetical protein